MRFGEILGGEAGFYEAIQLFGSGLLDTVIESGHFHQAGSAVYAAGQEVYQLCIGVTGAATGETRVSVYFAGS